MTELEKYIIAIKRIHDLYADPPVWLVTVDGERVKVKAKTYPMILATLWANGVSKRAEITVVGQVTAHD